MASTKPKTAAKPAAKFAKRDSKAAKPVRGAKREAILTLMRRTQGATMAELMAATDWQPHSTRAVISGLRKEGHAIALDKSSGASSYKIAATA
jgi:hypothetical protein